MHWEQGVHLIQSALAMAVWLSLPLLLAIVGAGLIASRLQAAIGVAEAGVVVPARLLGAMLGVLVAGAWMLSFSADYWTALWRQAAQIATGSP